MKSLLVSLDKRKHQGFERKQVLILFIFSSLSLSFSFLQFTAGASSNFAPNTETAWEHTPRNSYINLLFLLSVPLFGRITESSRTSSLPNSFSLVFYANVEIHKPLPYFPLFSRLRYFASFLARFTVFAFNR